MKFPFTPSKGSIETQCNREKISFHPGHGVNRNTYFYFTLKSHHRLPATIFNDWPLNGVYFEGYACEYAAFS